MIFESGCFYHRCTKWAAPELRSLNVADVGSLDYGHLLTAQACRLIEWPTRSGWVTNTIAPVQGPVLAAQEKLPDSAPCNLYRYPI